MAKGEHRAAIGFFCSVCKSRNYMMERNKLNTPDKLVLKKYCRRCRKKTEHHETEKFK